jgi:hypothetical protein
VTSPLADRVAGLVVDIAERVPQPLDRFEIAAVIESTGVTDPVARDDYGYDDVFALADVVFPAVLARNANQNEILHDPHDRYVLSDESTRSAVLGTTARGLLAVAPIGLLLLTIHALRTAGWTTSRILAFSLGVTAAMLCTSGPILAIGHRTSIYVGLEQRWLGRRFLVRASAALLSGCIAIAALLFETTRALDVFGVAQREIFAGAFLATSVLWVLVAGLSFTGSPRRAVAGIVGALMLGVAIGVVYGAVPGLLVGYGAATCAVSVAWHRRAGKEPDRGARLPSLGLLLLEGLPYALFGAALAVLLIEPHVLGWEGHVDGSSATALDTFELSFMLALPPLLVGTALNERLVRSVWSYMGERRERTGADAFRRDVSGFVARRIGGSLAVVVALSAVDLLVVGAAYRRGDVTGISKLVFVSALGGFVLLWLGQMGCLLMLSLSRPFPAFVSALTAACTLAVVGVPLALVDYTLAAPAFALAAAVFALVALGSCHRLMRRADFHYATAF